MAILSQFPSGGGMKVNGTVAQRKVKDGSAIIAGDFVGAITALPDVQSSALFDAVTFVSPICKVKLNETDTLVISGVTTIYGCIVSRVNGDAVVGSRTKLASGGTTGCGMSCCKMEDGRLVLLYGGGGTGNRYLYGKILTITGTAISAGSEQYIQSYGYAGYAISAVALDGNKLFIAHCYGNSASVMRKAYGTVATVSGDTIAVTTNTALSAQDYSGLYVSAVKLSNSKVLVLHSYSQSVSSLTGVVVDISGNTVTLGSSTRISTVSSSARCMSPVRISESRVMVVHGSVPSGSTQLFPYGIVVNIAGSVISFGADTQLSTNTTEMNDAALMDDGTITLCYMCGSYIYAAKITVSSAGEMSAPTSYMMDADAGSCAAALNISNDKLTALFGGSGITLKLLDGYTESVVKPTDGAIAGIAKTGGAGGQTIDVIVP